MAETRIRNGESHKEGEGHEFLNGAEAPLSFSTFFFFFLLRLAQLVTTTNEILG